MDATTIDWQRTDAAVWRPYLNGLRAIDAIDHVDFANFVGLDRQIAALRANTTAFIDGRPANHVLLWGARGTGKSSLVKATLRCYAPQRLRLIEIDRADLAALPQIIDTIRTLDWRFVLFCDDLSFAATADDDYRLLKRLMAGTIEAPPANVLFYATANRRHLLPEYRADNLSSHPGDNGELHHGDAVEDGLSLADRFGLTLSFYTMPGDDYVQLVRRLCSERRLAVDDERLVVLARRYGISRGGYSGRVAEQFVIALASGQFDDA